MQSETACLSVDSRCPLTSQTCWNEEMNWTTGQGSRERVSERGGQVLGPDGLGCCQWGPNNCAGRVG